MALYAFDGTWNREHDQAHYSENSNVVKFAKAYRDPKAVFQKKGDTMVVVENDHGYVSGPGTRHGFFGKAFGGAFGLGGRERVNEALARAERRFAAGDRVIDVVGFSRGAAIALHFVNKLAGATFGGVKPRVRFLGLWDAVAAFGIPKDFGALPFHKLNIGWQLMLPPIVDHCFHALALDERRETFQPTRPKGAYEVWFRGVHSDIGGGNSNEPMNNVALRWMLRKAAAVGVPVDAKIADTIRCDATIPISRNTDPRKDPFRSIAGTDWMHYSITARNEPEVCQNPLPECPRETEAFERSQTRLVI